MVNPLYLVTFIFLFSLSAQAEELLRRVSLTDTSALHAGELIDDGTLRITGAPGQAFRLLFELPDPGISLPVYALKGSIRYHDVESDGFLQLDNHFGRRGTYFSKSLAPAGPLGKISGSSDWRAFVLPFYANAGDQVQRGETWTPEKLSLSIYLPGGGTVFIRDIGLYQYASGEDPLQPSGQWINSRAVILLGAIGGSVVGLWGALVGTLASRGKARGFVIGSATLLIVIGVFSIVCGIAALALGQPYAVYYPLLLIGAILVFVIGGLRRTLPKRYEAMELKKMRALDA